MQKKITIIGGAGHIGLPLGILFAAKKKNVVLYDKNNSLIKKINKCQFPFVEKNGAKLLKKCLNSLKAADDINSWKVIIVYQEGDSEVLKVINKFLYVKKKILIKVYV